MSLNSCTFCFARFQDAFDAHKLGPKMHKKWRIGETGVMCMSNEQRLGLHWYHFAPARFAIIFSYFVAQLELSIDPCEFRSLLSLNCEEASVDKIQVMFHVCL